MADAPEFVDGVVGALQTICNAGFTETKRNEIGAQREIARPLMPRLVQRRGISVPVNISLAVAPAI